MNKVGDENKNLSNYLNTMTKQIRDIEHLITEFSDFARMPKPILKSTDVKKIVTCTQNTLYLQTVYDVIKIPQVIKDVGEKKNKIYIKQEKKVTCFKLASFF